MIEGDNKDGIYNLRLGEKFRDYDCSVKLGEIKEALRRKDRPVNVRIDFSSTLWADPLPLLSLGAVLHTVSDYGTKVVIILGQPNQDYRHLVFLKFLATQGFIEAYSQFCEFEWDNNRFVQQERKALIAKLSEFQQPTNYRNADCIFAKLIGVNDYREDPEHYKLHEKVEMLVNEANDRLIDSAYGRNPLVRDRLLQKARKVIFELLCNIIEHAYPESFRGEPVKGYAGVYARMRASLPGNMKEATEWRKLLGTERLREHCPCLNRFEVNPLAPWIEIFICDTGVGLLSHVDKWTASEDRPDIQIVLDELKSNVSGSPLLTLSKILFTEPFSSIENRTGVRTSVTGLLHLGLMLQRDGDFTRIYTHGEWAGSRLPWNPNEIGGHSNIAKQHNRIPSDCAPGTWFAFSIQPIQLDLEYPECWVVASKEDRERLIKALSSPPLEKLPSGVRFEDRRGDRHCSLPKEWVIEEKLRNEMVFDRTPVVILRPPRTIQKRQVGRWLNRLADAASFRSTDAGASRFILTDMTPFQAVTYAEMLAHHDLPALCSIEIYLVAEDWSVCCLSKLPTKMRSRPTIDLTRAKEFMCADLEVSVTDIPVASNTWLLRFLRFADSSLFWQYINQPSYEDKNTTNDIFVHGQVKWPNSRETNDFRKTSESKNIHGYLDLSRALVDMDRYQACHRALRRCMNLFPEFDALASDDLVHSITIDADYGRYRPRTITPQGQSRSRKKLVVGSIRVTSTTVARFLTRADVPEGSCEIYIFNHPDALTISGKYPLTVLDWIPPKPSTVEAEYEPTGYERIPETPFIGKGGESAIKITRFKQPRLGVETLTDSYYERNPQQTYDDFHKLRALKLGHWIYGNKHDLLTIHLGRAIELSVLDNGSLYRWLIKTIDNLCFVTEDGKEPKPIAVLLYPSHPITDQIIAILGERSRRHISSGNGSHRGSLLPETHIIPLKFLTNNTVSPLRTSPLSYDCLKSAIDAVRKGVSKCRIVILDDGTLSGKMFRELEQLSRSLGADEIHTIAIVDRGGLPIHLDFMDEFVSEHHRFWRWDVPPLGHRRGCPLCAALAQVSAMRERSFSPSIKRRLTNWAEIWGPVEVISNWESSGLEPLPLGNDRKSDSHRFCIYNNEPKSATHTIRHRTSTSMASAIMEITRSTTRSYYALEKSSTMVKQYGPRVGIEILCAQLLLFFDELNYWDKLDRLRELLSLLWSCHEDSEVTALNGLCLMLTDDDLIQELWTWFKCNLLRKEKVPIHDARIVAEFLRNRFNNLHDIDQDRLSSDSTDEERYNYLIIFSDSTYRHHIAKVFEIIGASHRDIHNIGLSACLKDIKEAVRKQEFPLAVRLSKKALNVLEDLADALENINIRFCIRDTERQLDPKTDSDKLKQLINKIPRPTPDNEVPFLTGVQSWATMVENELLNDNNAQSLACCYRPQFIKNTDTKTAMSAFLSKLTSQICDIDWEEIVATKIAKQKPVAERWISLQQLETSDDRPLIESGNRGNWQKEIQIYYDRYVEHCLYEILTNCVHVNEDITNPWTLPSDDASMEVKATMWWKIWDDGSFVNVEFVNASDRTEIPLNPTEAHSGLERVGGDVISFVVDGSSSLTAYDNVVCPVSVEHLNELRGLDIRSRAAITIVKIPLMKTLQER